MERTVILLWRTLGFVALLYIFSQARYVYKQLGCGNCDCKLALLIGIAHATLQEILVTYNLSLS